MALGKKRKFDIERIKKIIENEYYITNSKIADEEIIKIYNDYSSNYWSGSLENIKNEILNLLNKNLPKSVHSVRGRVKDPDHLIEKIYRKTADDEAKYGLICEDNYNKLITDLIGIRIIIMDKREWREVHDCLLELFHNDPAKYITCPKDLITNYDKYGFHNGNKQVDDVIYHVEKPVVYAISEDDRLLYVDDNLSFNQSREKYRSIHYIIRYSDVYFEIQVRTIFEEGWLEFDHRIKYPYDNKNIRKKEYIDILNSLAQAADKLISFYDEKDFKQSYQKRGVRNSTPVTNHISNKETDTIQDKLNSLF